MQPPWEEHESMRAQTHKMAVAITVSVADTGLESVKTARFERVETPGLERVETAGLENAESQSMYSLRVILPFPPGRHNFRGSFIPK